MSAGTGKLTWTEDLAAELHAARQRLETESPEEIIAWAVERFFPKLTMATAFGPEGCVILAMLANLALIWMSAIPGYPALKPDTRLMHPIFKFEFAYD